MYVHRGPEMEKKGHFNLSFKVYNQKVFEKLGINYEDFK